MNPVPFVNGMKLSITDADNALDLELVREVAHYFRSRSADANEIIANFDGGVGRWRTIADALRLPACGGLSA